jgi:hypothetical protein
VDWSLGARSHGETHAATQAQVGEALRLVSLCDGQIIAGVTDGIIGFVWVTVHHVTVLRKIFARTAAGTAHELGLPALLRPPASSCWADDVDQEYGLHGYTVHVSLRTAATELYAETFRHVAARGGQSASAVVNFGLCNAEDEPALMRRIGGALRLPWRTACMNGVATRAVLVDVTVFDEAMVPRIYCTRLGLLEPPSPSQAAVRSLGFPGLLCVKEAQWSLRMELLVLYEHIDGPGTFSKDSTACFVTRACLEARVSLAPQPHGSRGLGWALTPDRTQVQTALIDQWHGTHYRHGFRPRPPTRMRACTARTTQCAICNVALCIASSPQNASGPHAIALLSDRPSPARCSALDHGFLSKRTSASGPPPIDDSERRVPVGLGSAASSAPRFSANWLSDVANCDYRRSLGDTLQTRNLGLPGRGARPCHSG